MNGRRRPDGYHGPVSEGDYYRDAAGKWWARPPNSDLGVLDHEVEEHDDGTITVSPSIAGDAWHGYLRRGEWSEA